MTTNIRLRRLWVKLALLLVMLLSLIGIEQRAAAGDPYCEYYCYQYYIGYCPSGQMPTCQRYYQDCLSHC